MSSVTRFVTAALIATGVALGFPLLLLAQNKQPPQKISACALVPKEEVKKHLPWMPLLDQMAVEEEPIGKDGSSCNYPSVFIQVLPFSQRMIDSARKKGGLEPISGLGDEAYFHNNRDRYAELYVKTGQHLLTLQANVQGKIEAVKPGVLNLAKVLVAKLR